MKKTIILICLAGILSFDVELMSQDLSSWSSGKHMKEAVNQTLANAITLEQNSNYGFTDKSVCLLCAFQKVGGSNRITIRLNSDNQYIFMGGGDSDVTDLDIVITDSEGVEVAKDKKADNSPIVNFNPSSSNSYTVSLNLYSSNEDRSSFSCMAILIKGGYSVPVSTLDNTINNFMTIGIRANEKTGIKFHDYENQWCLYGNLLEEGNSNTISSIRLGDEDHIIIATGDDSASDIDLFLLKNDEEIETDTETDSTPVLIYSTKDSERYGIKTKLISTSKSASFVVTGIFTD